jgi:hypothetical protein
MGIIYTKRPDHKRYIQICIHSSALTGTLHQVYRDYVIYVYKTMSWGTPRVGV